MKCNVGIYTDSWLVVCSGTSGGGQLCVVADLFVCVLSFCVDENEYLSLSQKLALGYEFKTHI